METTQQREKDIQSNELNNKKTMEMEATQNKRNAANFHKEQGNKFVKLNEFGQAINCYTLAIDANPSDAVFYSNRAFCFLKLKK